MTALAAAAAATPLAAASRSEPPPNKRPKLIVLIVVDQLGTGLLEKHESHLTGGLRRLIEHGRRFPTAVVDHAPTNSLPGHLSAASGAYPKRHGIIDNSWFEWSDGKPRGVLGFADPACTVVTSVGPQVGREGLGPSRFESPTIVEWVKQSDPSSKFVSIGTGGGVSALHAGRARGPVLWFSPSDGGYISSSCYADSLPSWAVRFNYRLSQTWMQKDWELTAPAAMLAGLRADEAAFEHRGKDTSFPHRRPADSKELPRWFNNSPFADQATLALAATAIDSEGLGEDSVPDILTLGLSTIDHIGHSFGPYSVEQADALYQLDQNLGAFFDLLDRRVGTGEWAVALTADHGAPPAPEDAARWGISGARRVSEAQALAAIDSIVRAAEPFTDPTERTSAARKAAESLDFVAHVIGGSGPGTADKEISRLYANSYRAGRTSLHPLYPNDDRRSAAEFGIVVIPPPYVVIDWATSIHGSPYDYDRKVALFFMGPGVSPGTSAAEARTIDVAPTLGSLAGVQPTAEIDGRILPLIPTVSTNIQESQ